MEETVLKKKDGNEPKKKVGLFGFLARYFSAPLIAVLFYLVPIIAYKIVPFGDKYIVANYDLSAQICPYIEHFFDVFQGKSSLFYSFSIAGGSDVFCTLAYFFLSPFSFLFLLFGDGNVYNACAVVMACKLASIAFVGTWFVRKYGKEIPPYIATAMGVLYAYCGYTFVANTYINWMDFLICLPLCVSAFLRMQKTGKFFLFSLLVALCVYTCFSIACFSMFTVFPLLIFYALICGKKGERSAFCARICLSFFTAIVLALPVLVPALYGYLHAARGGGIFEDFYFGFQGSALDKKGYLDWANTALYRKWSYIFSDSVFLILTVSYLAKSRLKTPTAKFMLLSGAVLTVPLLFDEAMILQNMGSYMSYALRFGFLNAFYLFGGAVLRLKNVAWTQREYDQNRKKHTLVYGVICLLFACLLTAFAVSGGYRKVWDKFVKDSSTLASFHDFSGMFAHSLGGIQVVLVFFVAILILALVGAILVKTKKISVRSASWLLICVLAVQVGFYSETLVRGNFATHENGDAYAKLVRTLDEREDGYYRIKDYADVWSANEPFTSQANSYSAFSSMLDRDNFAVAELFGYRSNGKNSIKSTGGNFFGDCLLHHKYIFVSEERKDAVANLSYTEEVHVEGADGVEVLHAGKYYAYKNSFVFPLAFKVQGGGFQMPKANTPQNRRANQTALYNYLYGENLYTESDTLTNARVMELSQKLHLSEAESVKVGAGKIKVEITGEEGESLLLPFIALKGYSVKINGKTTKLLKNDLKFLCVALQDGENVVEFTYVSPYPKFSALSAIVAVFVLVAMLIIIKRTKAFEKTKGIVSVAGILLAVACIGFFTLYPLGEGAYKLILALK